MTNMQRICRWVKSNIKYCFASNALDSASSVTWAIKPDFKLLINFQGKQPFAKYYQMPSAQWNEGRNAVPPLDQSSRNSSISASTPAVSRCKRTRSCIGLPVKPYCRFRSSSPEAIQSAQPLTSRLFSERPETNLLLPFIALLYITKFII